MAALAEFDDSMTADVAGAAGDEDEHVVKTGTPVVYGKRLPTRARL